MSGGTWGRRPGAGPAILLVPRTVECADPSSKPEGIQPAQEIPMHANYIVRVLDLVDSKSQQILGMSVDEAKKQLQFKDR